ncbi:MAG: hypothetical protein KDA68_16915 [Planctomycetaceae bacterium]|nr:hypothetical protein [Planctomycetaceae bacterium]
MNALSMDLRERIVAAYQAGEGSHRVLAERFAVSKAVVGKLVRQIRNSVRSSLKSISAAGSLRFPEPRSSSFEST